MISHKFKIFGSLLFFSALQVSAQEALDASNGVAFGLGTSDPTASKGAQDQDLEFEFFNSGKMQIFRNGETLPSFQAGEGFSANVQANKWYRIAQSSSSGKRANAEFSLRDDISGGGHSTAVFRAGISFGDANRAGLTLLSHTGYIHTTFGTVRIVEGSTYQTSYLEVYVRRSGAVRFSMKDNLGNGGWTPIDWTLVSSTPSGYVARNFNIDKSFVVGDYKPRLSVGRGGRVDVDGSLYLNNSSVVTQTSAPFLLSSKFASRGGVANGAYLEFGANSLADGLNAVAIGKSTQAKGESATSLGSESKALASYSFAAGRKTQAKSSYAATFGYNTTAAYAGFAAGYNSDAIGSYSVGMGYNADAKSSFSSAFGYQTQSGYGSLAAGFYSYALPHYSASFGRYNSLLREDGTASGLNSNSALDPVFSVGNGTSTSNRKNALTVYRNGNAEIQNNLTVNGTITVEPQGDVPMGIFGGN